MGDGICRALGHPLDPHRKRHCWCRPRGPMPRRLSKLCAALPAMALAPLTGQALREYSPDEALVLRSGRLARVPASSLVRAISFPFTLATGARGLPHPLLLILVLPSRPGDAHRESMSSARRTMLSRTKAPSSKIWSTWSLGTTVVNGAAKAVVVLTAAERLSWIHTSISKDDDEDEKRR